MPKDTPLKVEIVDDEIVIRVGVSILKWAVEHPLDDRLTVHNDETGKFMCFDITDEEEFARDVLRALNDEDEQGTTMVHRLLDNAFVEAVDNGSIGVAEEMKEVVY